MNTAKIVDFDSLNQARATKSALKTERSFDPKPLLKVVESLETLEHSIRGSDEKTAKTLQRVLVTLIGILLRNHRKIQNGN